MGAPVMPGDVLAGKYLVDRILGEGGMGVVVAARHVHLEQSVALKFLRPEVVANPVALDRFVREARNAVRLKSEHVARILDVGTLDNGAPYIVMEYLEGSDLAGVLAQRRTLPIPVAVDFILQTCDAIAEAHALGIIHRDLKPQNLFLTRRHDNMLLVKVLDFGISKSLAGGDFAATLSQTVMGSPAYMSPEQMRSTKFVDVRTDVWALGIILYQLVTGYVPWKGEAFTEICLKIATDPLPRLPSTQPPGFEEVVRRCLEKDPNRRFSDVYALAVALSPFAPKHALPLVESIGRVLRSPADKHDAIMAIGRVLRGQAGEHDAITTIEPSTLHKATGQSMKHTAMGSRPRRVARLVGAIGMLAGVVGTAVALGGGRSGKRADEPMSSPRPDRAAAYPNPAIAPSPVATTPAPSLGPKPEPLTIHEALRASTPPPKFEPLSTPSIATSPHDKERLHDLPIATPSKPQTNAPHIVAPHAITPPSSTRPPPLPTARDPLSSPD